MAWTPFWKVWTKFWKIIRTPEKKAGTKEKSQIIFIEKEKDKDKEEKKKDTILKKGGRCVGNKKSKETAEI